MPEDLDPSSPRRTGGRRTGDGGDDGSPDPTPPGFWQKLQRRGLVHLTVVYLGVAWVSIQVIHLFIDRELLPAWSFYLLLVLLAAGFPIVLLLAWVQESPAPSESASGREAPSPGRWIQDAAERVDTGHILIALAVLVGGLGLGWLLLDDAPPFASGQSDTGRWSVMTVAFDPGGRAVGVDSARAVELRHVFDSSVEWILGVPVVRLPDPGGTEDGPTSLPDRIDAARRAGARYLVTGSVFDAGRGEQGLTLQVYATDDGERLGETGSGGTEPIAHAAARLATDVAELIARREDLDVDSKLEVAAATSSPVARVELISAQRDWWEGDLDGAAESFRRAISADSSFSPAYFRLSFLETFRWDYPAALKVADAGLDRPGDPGRKWRMLLEALRHYVRHEGEEAIRTFQQVVGEYPDSPDGWLGLSEALLHYGGVTGRCQTEALPAFRGMLRTDSTFAPTHYHLIHLHLLLGDEEGARQQVARTRSLGPPRRAHAMAVDLVFGDPATRDSILRSLHDEERFTVSSLVFLLTLGGVDLEAADRAAAGLLEGPARTRSDRVRGAQYRLVARAGLDRWDEAVDAWSRVDGDPPIDRFMIEAYLAGFPADSLVRPMFEWAESLLASGRIPDFGLALEDPRRQGFRALVHRAALKGDSASVERLLATLGAAETTEARRTDPLPGLARSALRARLALLAADTARAVTTLEEAMGRVWQVETGFYPLTSMAAERMLLAELLLARGDREAGNRRLRSLFNTWSLGDALYHPKALRLASRHGLPPPPEQCAARTDRNARSLTPTEGADR